MGNRPTCCNLIQGFNGTYTIDCGPCPQPLYGKEWNDGVGLLIILASIVAAILALCLCCGVGFGCHILYHRCKFGKDSAGFARWYKEHYKEGEQEYRERLAREKAACANQRVATVVIV